MSEGPQQTSKEFLDQLLKDTKDSVPRETLGHTIHKSGELDGTPPLAWKSDRESTSDRMDPAKNRGGR